MDELTTRIIELEIRYTHQGQMIEELNAELTASNSRIDQLERDLRGLRTMVSRLDSSFEESPDE